MPGYSVVVSLPASNRARLPVGGIEAVVKETVDKRKKPETVTTHNNQTTTTKKIKEKKGGTKEIVHGGFSLQSDAIVRAEASVVVPRALTPIFQWEQEGFKYPNPSSPVILLSKKAVPEGREWLELNWSYLLSASQIITTHRRLGDWSPNYVRRVYPIILLTEQMFNNVATIHHLPRNTSCNWEVLSYQGLQFAVFISRTWDWPLSTCVQQSPKVCVWYFWKKKNLYN